MSESSGEAGGAPLSDGQFGDGLTETEDLPQTAQTPGNGIFSAGWYPWFVSQRPRPRKRKRGDE